MDDIVRSWPSKCKVKPFVKFLSVFDAVRSIRTDYDWLDCILCRRCRRRLAKGGTKTLSSSWSSSSLRKRLDVEASRRQLYEDRQGSRYAKIPPTIRIGGFLTIVPEVGIADKKCRFKVSCNAAQGCAGRESRFPPRSARRIRPDLAVTEISRSMSCQPGRNTLGGCQRRRHADCYGARCFRNAG